MKKKLIHWLIGVAVIIIFNIVVYPMFIDPYVPINTGNGSNKLGDTVTIDNLEYTINKTQSDAYSGGSLSYILGTGKKTVHVSITIKNPTNKDYTFNINSHFVVLDTKADNPLISLTTKDLNNIIAAGRTIQGEFSYEAQSNHRYFIMNIWKNTNDKFQKSDRFNRPPEIALINLVTP